MKRIWVSAYSKPAASAARAYRRLDCRSHEVRCGTLEITSPPDTFGTQ